MTAAETACPIERRGTGTDPVATQPVCEQLLHDRFSCRGYLPNAVPRKTIERILDMAQFTASWCNSQPWEVLITEGAGTERFRDVLYAHSMTTPPDQ